MLFIEENTKKYNLHLTKNGNFYNNITKKTYYYHYACSECGYAYLNMRKHALYCGTECMYKSEEHRKKIGKSGENNHNFGRTGDLHPMFGRTGEKSPLYGRKRPDTAGENNPSRRLEVRKKISESKIGIVGDQTSGWKGGYYTNNIPMYDTYSPKLEPYEQCRRNKDDPNIIDVKCAYCGNWYTPTLSHIYNRIKGINGNDTSKFYCSSECKQECPIFWKQKHLKGNKPYAESRIYQQELKIRVFDKDNGICQICGAEVTLQSSICHHEIPVAINPIISLDDDNCWTLCIDCNKRVHKLPGCTYNEIKNNICKEVPHDR